MVAARQPDKVRALIVEDSPLRLNNYRRIIDSSHGMFALWLDLKNTAQSEQDLFFRLADAYKGYPGVTSGRRPVWPSAVEHGMLVLPGGNHRMDQALW
jgi:hypothetical protein